MLKMFQFIYLVSYLLVGIESAKILGVFPTPSISHQVVFRPLMLELAKRGHDVTVITTDPAFPKGQAPQNLTEIDLHDISYDHWNKFMEEGGNETNPRKILQLVTDMILKLVEKQLKSDEVQKFLQNNEKIDVLFIESYIQPALIFSHIYNVPVIEFSSAGGFYSTFEMIGATTHPLIYPDMMQRRIYNLTLWEKISELHFLYMVQSVFIEHTTDNKILKPIFGSDVPSLKDLRRNVQMLFLNLHYVWDFNRPVPPNVVYLGDMHQKTKRELPKDLKSYLDSSENGVIYISFGTNVKTSWIPSEKLKIFTDVFSQLPYDVLWKWDEDELPERSKNIKISKWLPQSDLLQHPKIKLFITQGGLQSTDEAITAGVPLVGVPMLGDQWFNVEQYIKFNIGKKLEIETLTEGQLVDAIKTVIEEKSYRKNVVKLRDIMRDQPEPPLERAVWWTEHVLRHGGAHLRAPAAHMHWTEYYELELVLTLLSAFALIILVSMLAIYFIFSIVRYYMRVKVKVS